MTNGGTCSLNDAELATRLAEWAQVTSKALSRQMESGRIVARYPRDPEIRARLNALIDAERECCPFLEFSVTDGDDDMTVELRFPPDDEGAVGWLTALLEARSVV